MYNQKDFLEFFDEKDTWDQEAEIFDYVKHIDKNLILSVHLSVYDQYTTITLIYKKKTVLFDILIRWIGNIKILKKDDCYDCINFYDEDEHLIISLNLIDYTFFRYKVKNIQKSDN